MESTQEKSTKEISNLNLFYAIQVELAERGKTEFEMDRVEWHKAYYDAKNHFPDVMEHFEVRLRINPYLHGLETGIQYSLLTGHLSMIVSANGEKYRTERIEGIKQHLSKVDNNTKEIAKYICDLIE